MNLTKTKVKREVVTVVEDEGFTIELNREEACALLAVLGRINGWTNKDNVRAVVTAPLWHALNDALGWTSDDVVKYYRNISKSMTIGDD